MKLSLLSVFAVSTYMVCCNAASISSSDSSEAEPRTAKTPVGDAAAVTNNVVDTDIMVIPERRIAPLLAVIPLAAIFWALLPSGSAGGDMPSESDIEKVENTVPSVKYFDCEFTGTGYLNVRDAPCGNIVAKMYPGVDHLPVYPSDFASTQWQCGECLTGPVGYDGCWIKSSEGWWAAVKYLGCRSVY